MVYGKDGLFDAATLIDVLQALEKFTAVKDDGDGSAFKKKKRSRKQKLGRFDE